MKVIPEKHTKLDIYVFYYNVHVPTKALWCWGIFFWEGGLHHKEKIEDTSMTKGVTVDVKGMTDNAVKNNHEKTNNRVQNNIQNSKRLCKTTTH